MADYAALLNAEKKKTSPSPTKDIQQVKKPASPQGDKPASMQNRLTASPQVDKAASSFAAAPVLEKAERYTTRLQPSLVKRIKIYAAEQDITDYEVVKQAVEAYLAKKK